MSWTVNREHMLHCNCIGAITQAYDLPSVDVPGQDWQATWSSLHLLRRFRGRNVSGSLSMRHLLKRGSQTSLNIAFCSCLYSNTLWFKQNYLRAESEALLDFTSLSQQNISKPNQFSKFFWAQCWLNNLNKIHFPHRSVFGKVSAGKIPFLRLIHVWLTNNSR